MRTSLLVVVGVVTVGVVGVGIYLARGRGGEVEASKGVTARPVALATLPVSRPASRPSYFSLMVEGEPRLRRGKALEERVPLETAAAVVTKRPVYLDGRGDLWVMHPEAPGIAEVLEPKAEPTTKPVPVYKEQVHFSRDEVVYAYWSRDGRGNWAAQVVTREGEGGEWGKRFVWNRAGGKKVALARGDYRFEKALVLEGRRIVVPTADGVSVLVPTDGDGDGAGVTEVYGELKGGRTAVCVFPVHPSGSVVAFKPWENGDPGSENVLRLVTVGEGEGGKPEWKAFEAEMFPARPIHAFALTDGSTLVLSAGEDAGVELEVLLPFERKDADPGEVRRLIAQLSTGKEEERRAAQGALARYGPSAWPVIEEAMEEGQMSEEARATLTRLLGARAKPTLGIFTLLPGPVRVMARDVDGSLALYTYGGTSFLDLGKEKLRSPALLLALPGAPVRLAHESVLADAVTGEMPEAGAELPRMSFRNGELMVLSEKVGLTRHMGNHLAPMLRSGLRGFQKWLGSDREGRWVFENEKTGQYLILDPNYADPTPRLPAWTMTIDGGKTGWDARDNPVISRGAKQTFRIGASGWESADEAKAEERIVTELGAGKGEAKAPTTRLVLPGNLEPGTVAEQVFKPGKDEDAPVFLYDRPGRILRYGRNEAGEYVHEATFTEKVPKENIRRVWLDSLGRICVAHGASSLTILFPEGRYPSELVPLISNEN